MDRNEAIDNLRVTVRAALAVAPQATWQTFGHEYLRHTEPHTEGRDLLYDIVTDRLNTLGPNSQPLLPAGREWHTCEVVRHFLLALDYYTKEDYMNATLECEHSIEIAYKTSQLTRHAVGAFQQQVKRSLYGKDAILN